jgi:hypothetical protein
VWTGYPGQYGGARCEAQRSIDVRNWHRRNLLTPPGRAFAWRWAGDGESASPISVLVRRESSILRYGWRSVDRNLHLARGGHRPWFVWAPAIGDVGCSTSTADRWACRMCCDLRYQSELERKAGCGKDVAASASRGVPGRRRARYFDRR